MSLSLGLGLGLTRNKGVGVLRFTSALPPGVSYARTGAATALTSGGVVVPFAANVPQLTDRGLLLEPAATNLCLRSQELENAAWTAGNEATITANQAAAPDGTTTADKVAGGGFGFAVDIQVIGVTGGATYDWSVFGEAGSLSALWLRASDGTSTWNRKFLMSGAGSSAAGFDGVAPAAYSIEQLFGGYYRSQIRFTVAPGATSVSARLYCSDATVVTSADFIYGWGAQFEQAALATSYIPTTTAATTRGLPAASVTVPAGKTVARVTYGLSNTVVDVTGLTPGATFDLVTARPWLGLGNELKTLEWRP